MILDETNLKILEFFSSLSESTHKNPTTWELSKKLFPNVKNESEQKSKHMFVKKRIHRMNGDIFFINKDEKGVHEYILIKDNIKFCKHKFPSGLKKAIMIKVQKKWM